jgi:hypothetical protein
LFNWIGWLNFFPQILHPMSFPLWCRFRWIFKVLFCAVAYSQNVHLKGFSPENVRYVLSMVNVNSLNLAPGIYMYRVYGQHTWYMNTTGPQISYHVPLHWSSGPHPVSQMVSPNISRWTHFLSSSLDLEPRHGITQPLYTDFCLSHVGVQGPDIYRVQAWATTKSKPLWESKG